MDTTLHNDSTRSILIFLVNVKDCEYINNMIRDYENSNEAKPLIPIIDLLLNDLKKIPPEKYSKGLFYNNTLFIDKLDLKSRNINEPFTFNDEYYVAVLNSTQLFIESIKEKILLEKELNETEFLEICIRYLYYKSAFFEDTWFINDPYNYIIFSESFVAKWPKNLKIFKHMRYEEYCDEFKEANFLKEDEHQVFNVFPESDLLELKKMISKDKASLKENFPFQLEILEKMIHISEISRDNLFLWI